MDYNPHLSAHMAAANSTVSLEELRSFHRIDRALYTVLVKDLFRDPSECMKIMGLWLWFERRGYPNAINQILKLPPFLVNEFANEAETCLMRMNNQLNDMNEIPLTQCLVGNEMSLQYFQDNGPTILHRVLELATDLFMPVLSDIMEQAQRGVFLQARESSSSQSTSLVHYFSRLSIGGEASSSRSGLIRTHEVSRHERTMFVTFSKGYPVNEDEVRQFFEERFGQCLESFHMQEVADGEQALYARMVFQRSYYITEILQGDNTAKFSINGKHVWMRRFMSRTTRLLI